MSKNRFCFSKKLLLLVFVFLLITISIIYINKYINSNKVATSSQAQSPNSNIILPPEIYLKNILDYCQINNVYDVNEAVPAGVKNPQKYPMVFDYYRNWQGNENTYARYGAYMVSWFIDEINKAKSVNKDAVSRFEVGAPLSDSDKKLIATSNKLLRTYPNPKCGIWEVAMRKLITDYTYLSTNPFSEIQPFISREQIRFFSANAIFFKSPTGYQVYLKEDNYTNPKDIKGLCYLDQKKPCATFDSVLSNLNLKSQIYTNETENNIPILFYTYQQSQAVRSIYHPNLDNLLEVLSGKYSQCGKPIGSNGEILTCGIVYLNVGEGIVSLLESNQDLATDFLQKKLNESCANNLSLYSSPFCNFNAKKSTDFLYIFDHLLKNKDTNMYGGKKYNEDYYLIAKKLQDSYKIYQQYAGLIAFISGILPSGEEVNIGDDYTTLATKNDQRQVLTTILNERKNDFIELEVGHGGIYTLCNNGHICIKTDLMALPQQKYELKTFFGSSSDIGYSAFFTLDVNSIDAPNTFNLIYTVSPFPLTTETEFNLSQAMLERLTKNLKPGGKLVIVYDPLFNQELGQKSYTTELAFETFQKSISSYYPGCTDCFSSGYIFKDNLGQNTSLSVLNPDLYFFDYMDSEFFLDMFGSGYPEGYMKSIVKAFIFTKPGK